MLLSIDVGELLSIISKEVEIVLEGKSTVTGKRCKFYEGSISEFPEYLKVYKIRDLTYISNFPGIKDSKKVLIIDV